MNTEQLLREIKKAEKEGDSKKFHKYEKELLEIRDGKVVKKSGFLSKAIMFILGVAMGVFGWINHSQTSLKLWLYLAIFGAIVSIWALLFKH